MKKKKNIRQRLFGYILLLGLLAIASTQLGWVYRGETEYTPVRVEKGDTVREIASRSTNDETDIRYVVSDIMETNHLSDTQDIYPGQILNVPVPSGDD